MMESLRRFFSANGRAGVIRFLLVCLVAVGAGWPLWTISWDRGMPINLLAGLIAGVAGAKLVAEAGRRLHDTGRSGWSGALILSALIGGAVAVGFYSARLPGPVTNAALIFLAAAASLLFLRPGQRIANAYGVPPSGYWTTSSASPGGFGAALRTVAIIAVGAGTGWFVTWLGEGMHTANERSRRSVEAYEARERTGRTSTASDSEGRR